MSDRDEKREVRSDDPSFSPETNRRLTEELREIVGADEVEVPADRPHHERERHATADPARASLSNVWLLVAVIGIAAGIAILIAAINSGEWWAVVIALLLDIGGLVLVLRMVQTMVGEHDKASPELAAEMEAEGDPSPDETVTQLVEEFREDPRRSPDRP